MKKRYNEADLNMAKRHYEDLYFKKWEECKHANIDVKSWENENVKRHELFEETATDEELAGMALFYYGKCAYTTIFQCKFDNILMFNMLNKPEIRRILDAFYLGIDVNDLDHEII